MNKRPPFTSPIIFPDSDDPAFNQRGAEAGSGRPDEQKPSKAARQHSHEAYAAQDVMDSMPPQENRGPLGGLFAGALNKEKPSGTKEAEESEADARQEDGPGHVCLECLARKDADEAHLRAMAELENSRKRLAREHEEQIRFAAEAVLSDILPALDNLDLALQHANNTDACKDFVTGIRMTRSLLLDALKKHGLEAVGTVGEEFDPALHEAVGMGDAPEVPEGCVCGMLSQGYTLNKRLLRPARVMVCKRGARN